MIKLALNVVLQGYVKVRCLGPKSELASISGEIYLRANLQRIISIDSRYTSEESFKWTAE